MKTIYKNILIAILTITASAASAAEFEINDAQPNNSDVVESRLQLTLFPGIARPAKNPLAMHMVETSKNDSSLLNLNSSLVEPVNTIKTEKYSDDIEVTNNNLFELRF